ncbi:hypothetical protein [Mucisphaera calidilacus]|uniref:Uncharacterized protein n=1 Tax=Mucisphaera calidilacus TaxID=2527982 RepID=A0A518BU20_9BACT|nr:hypothetical protein [Mucisphaera calidilacus]QDU70447.1 hypothetical protein Pan265_02740 [Mucisphaera calidilacus]
MVHCIDSSVSRRAYEALRKEYENSDVFDVVHVLIFEHGKPVMSCGLLNRETGKIELHTGETFPGKLCIYGDMYTEVHRRAIEFCSN